MTYPINSLYIEHPYGVIQVSGNQDRIFGREDFSFLTSDESSYISRKAEGGHFTIYSSRNSYGDFEFLIGDLGSKNGTLLNGREIRGMLPQVLREGDTISLGGTLPFRVKSYLKVRTTYVKAPQELKTQIYGEEKNTKGDYENINPQNRYYTNDSRLPIYRPMEFRPSNKARLHGKILLVISIISLIVSVSISSFALITINDTYEKALPIFDKIDTIKNNINTFDEEINKFDSYLNNIDTRYYIQMLSSIKTLANDNTVINVLKLVPGFSGSILTITDNIDKVEAILQSVDEVKSKLNYAKENLSIIKSALSEYETIKENIINYIKILKLYIVGTMIYCIILNGIIFYMGYYLLKLNKY